MRAANRFQAFACIAPLLVAGEQSIADENVVYVRAILQNGAIVPQSTSLVNGVLPPRFGSPAGVNVRVSDSDDIVLSSYSRWDPRLAYLEEEGPSQAPDGTQILISARVVDGMRRIRVADTSNATVLDQDLGPTLVAGCQSGDIAQEVCATFDSDGDGCKDLEDDDPLVPETIPPVLSVSVDPSMLWPPNHKMRSIEAVVEVTDNCDDSPVVVLSSITSSEPDDGLGDGDTANDIQDAEIGTLDLGFSLRAERAGLDPGRTYTVVYSATDRAGNLSMQTVTVVVPVSQ